MCFFYVVVYAAVVFSLFVFCWGRGGRVEGGGLPSSVHFFSTHCSEHQMAVAETNNKKNHLVFFRACFFFFFFLYYFIDSVPFNRTLLILHKAISFRLAREQTKQRQRKE